MKRGAYINLLMWGTGKRNITLNLNCSLVTYLGLCTLALGISLGNSIGFCEFERLGVKINWGASR